MERKNYFGIMLDCSRNAVMNVKSVKELIINMEKLGYNCLQLYTEDTYELNGEPLFGHLRGRYSKAELKEIDAFAALHGVELMPCIQTLAHLNQLFYWDKFYEVLDNTDILLVGDDKTYALIEKMFETCAECFTSRIINIGMDEAWLLGAGTYYDKYGPTERETIFLSHLNKLSEIAKKYGWTLTMWSDMFFRMAGYAEYYNKDAVIPDEVKAKVPDNVELIYWDYYTEDKAVYDGMLEAHKSFGKNAWFAGGIWKWIGFQASNRKTIVTTEPALKSCKDKGIKDVIMTVWGNDGSECSTYAVLPGLVYAAECAKGNYDIENAKKKMKEIFNEDWDDFMLCDLTMPDEVTLYREDATGAKEMLYSDPFLGKFDAGVSGTGIESKIYAKKTEQFKAAKARTEKYKYIFENYERLCRLLSVKYELGYRTRVAYQAGDKATLKEIVKDYDLCLKYLDEFIESFRELWMTENKPHGFDVHEIRLGGLILRLNSCKARLLQYLNGEIAKIEELEEKLVSPFIGELESAIPMFNRYRQTATLNTL